MSALARRLKARLRGSDTLAVERLDAVRKTLDVLDVQLADLSMSTAYNFYPICEAIERLRDDLDIKS